jgi:hypothetical protein
VIAVHRGSRRIGKNPDARQFRIVRLQETGRLPIHPDSTRDEVCVQRQGEPGAVLDAGDSPLPLERAEHLLDSPRFVRR